MLWQLEQLIGPQFLGFVRNVPTPEGFSGQRFLPDRTINDLTFEYVLGTNNRPVMASVQSWDAEAPVHGRLALGERVMGELPPIKRKANLGEKEIVRRLMQPRAGTSDEENAIADIYNLTVQLLDSVQSMVEWLRMKALSEDVVTYTDDRGFAFTFDYGITSAFQIDTDAAAGYSGYWTDVANSNPILDLQKLCNLIQQTKGFRPAVAVCSQEVLDLFPANQQMRDILRGPDTGPLTILSTGEINSLMTRYGLPTFVPYDVIVNKEETDGTLTPEYPLAKNKVILLPPPNVTFGNTLWGPTAEATRDLFGTALSSRAPGIYATLYGEAEPPTEWIKAVGVSFPSIPGADFIGQMTVKA